MAIRSDATGAVDTLEIARLRDPHGVLTVYVDADPQEQAATRPAWVVAAENGLREVRERAKAGGDRVRWAAVRDRLDELEPEIATLLDPRRPGRGRALFATVAGGEVRTVGLHLPLVNRVVLDDVAHIAPLAFALDSGRGIGIIAVSQSDLRVVERRLGLVEDVASFSLEPDTSDWRELKGPAAANPALAQHSAPQRDRFEKRLERHRVQILDSAVGEVTGIATGRGWEQVVVVGDPRLADRVAGVFERSRLDVATVDKGLQTLGAAEIAEAVAPELGGAAVRQERSLVARARDAALSGSAGALGLADVLTALEDGRVAHLLVADGAAHEGAMTAEGRLVPADVVPPGAQADELVPVLSLTEHLVERALATDARVTLVGAEAAEPLRASDGVAALLRW